MKTMFVKIFMSLRDIFNFLTYKHHDNNNNNKNFKRFKPNS